MNDMNKMSPINLDTLDVDAYIKRTGIQEVTSTSIKDSSTGKFDPEGLFSEEIFGEIGTELRMSKPGYISLITECLHPKVFKNLILMKRHYQNIMNSTAYAIFDKKLGEFVVVDESEPDADTGYNFFMAHFKELKFKPTTSPNRIDKVRMMDMYPTRDRLLCNKWIVIPAGMREYIEDRGVEGMEEINKMYISLIVLARAIPKTGYKDKMFDKMRMRVQRKINEIYDRLFGMLNGKKAALQGKYASRSLILGTRNVISSANTSSEELGDISTIKPNETSTPIFQLLKAYQPIIVHGMQRYFLNRVGDSSGSIPAIDPKTMNLVYVDIDNKEHMRLHSSDGIGKMISQFKDPELRYEPLSIIDVSGKKYYVYMVDDRDDTITLIGNPHQYLEYLNVEPLDLNELITEAESSQFKGLMNLTSGFGSSIVRSGSGSFSENPDDSGIIEIKDDSMLMKYHNEELMNWRKHNNIEIIFDNVLRFQTIPLIKNWLSMSEDKKKLSDDKLLEVKGCTNMSRIKKIIRKYNADLGVHSEQVTMKQLKDTQGVVYERPYNLQEIRSHNPDRYDALVGDKNSVHYWRATTGIELIHKEPTVDEFIRISKNWFVMTDDQKKKSDDKSKEFFKKTNVQHMEELIEYYNSQEYKTMVKKHPVKLRPLSMMEAFAIIIHKYIVTKNKNEVITRYPVNALGSVYPSKVRMVTSQKSRTVAFTTQSYGSALTRIAVIPNYPILGEPSVDSVQIHPARVRGLNADYDGDTISVNPVLGDESNEEIKKHYNSVGGLVDADGTLAINTTADHLVSLSLYNLSRDK